MKLRDLDAAFLRLSPDRSFRMYVDFKDAHGITFLCPKCFADNLKLCGNGRYGTHHVICWFTGVPHDVDPKPGRWNPSGTGLDDLTFVPPGAVSVLIQTGCMWHGFVSQGDAT